MEQTIIIAGAGGIGKSAALILAEWSEVNYKIYIGDANPEILNATMEWLKENTTGDPNMFNGFVMPLEGEKEQLITVLQKGDIILDCLPGKIAPKIAGYARTYNLHYVNLTEYVKETEEIVKISKNSEKGFVLQTGLAPGFINVLANKLFQDFCSLHRVDKVDRILMCVGAIPRMAKPPHYYGFTWSPIGVATEYLKDAKVLRNYRKTFVPALSEREILYVDGDKYEADITSGGAADLPEALEGRVKKLDYKTIRHVGHYDWVKDEIIQIKGAEKPSVLLQKMMEEKIPRVKNDIVIIFASVTGKNDKGQLYEIGKFYRIFPSKIGKTVLQAIQVSTAAPLVQIGENLLQGKIKGSFFQSQIDIETFFEGKFIKKLETFSNVRLFR